MKKIIQNRILHNFLALVGVIALGALASGIREMEFREPDPFYFEWPDQFGNFLPDFSPASGGDPA